MTVLAGYLSPYGVRMVANQAVTRGECWPTSEDEGEYLIHPDDFARLQENALHAEQLKARRWRTWKRGGELMATEQAAQESR